MRAEVRFVWADTLNRRKNFATESGSPILGRMSKLDPDAPMPGLDLPKHAIEWVADVKRRYPNGTPTISEMFSKEDLRDFDEGGMNLLRLLDFGYRRAHGLKFGRGQDAKKEAHHAATDEKFARAAYAIAREMVDNYRNDEKDANDRRVHPKPTKNIVAQRAFAAIGGKARSTANKRYDDVMTRDNLAKWGLTNPLDELSADT